MNTLVPRLKEWYQSIMGNSQCCEAHSEGDHCKSGPLQDGASTSVKAKPIPAGFTLLHGCTTMEEHEERVLSDLERVGFSSATSAQNGVRLRGEEGLKRIGFEFRFVPCSKHSSEDQAGISAGDKSSVFQEEKRVRFDFSTKNTDDRVGWHSCKDCVTRLFYSGCQLSAVQEPDGKRDESAINFSRSQATECDDDKRSSSSKDEPDTAVESVGHVSNSHSPVNQNSAAQSIGDVVVPPESCRVDEFISNMQPNLVGEAITERTDRSTQAGPCDSTISVYPAVSQSIEPTQITPQNRKQYIADGSHYELLSTLSQEAAHDIMRRTFNLEWVTLCDDERHNEHVKALVDADHPLALEEKEVVQELLGLHAHSVHEDEKKELDESNLEQSHQEKTTLLIATGRGKVRAGIFSRFHLLTAGIEVGTAWHNIREARIRNMGVVILDPNARGEQAGMETFKRSVIGLFTRAAEQVRNISKHGHDSTEQPTPQKPSSSIYILAHSASGGQLVRHLREDPSLLPTIRAIAFTDSTHNIQWCKDDPSLMQFLSTKNCIYLRSNDVRTSQSCIHVSSRGKDIACQCVNCADNRKSAGVVADTDSFWEHRFGKIRTLWAGTADHALSNWAGHDHIWLHFDRHAAKDGADIDSF